MPQSIIDQLYVPPELTLEFLAIFARFEFALKRAGYVLGNERGVQPDWNRFGRELMALDSADQAPIFICAEYLEANPPKRQVLKDGRLAWEPRKPEASRSEEILLNVRAVRNNVFHGGKFPDGRVEDPLRDERLIRSCLSLLYCLLDLSLAHDVTSHFRSHG